MLRVTVKDGERALLTRNGRLERVLGPGLHRLFDPARDRAAEVFAIVRAEFPADRYAVLKAARPDLVSALFEAVETKAGELAVVSYDGRPVHLSARGRRACSGRSRPGSMWSASTSRSTRRSRRAISRWWRANATRI